MSPARMHYAVVHVTSIAYAAPVRLARFNIRLRPTPWPTQTVRDFRLTINPLPWTRNDRVGAYIVNESKLQLSGAVSKLEVESRFRVEVVASTIDHATAASPTVAELRAMALTRPDLGPAGPASYLFASPIAAPSSEIAEWAAGLVSDDMPVLEAGRTLMNAIYRQFTYKSGITHASTPPIEPFQSRRGVCQDFAHIMIVAARSCGLPAAYVSGYLRTLPPPGRARLIGADAMHAWASLWCGDALGWVGFDPTNDVLAETDHIFVAMGRDYSDVAPLDGVFHGSARQKMRYSVDVAPVG